MRRGFTLIEMSIVLVLVGLLAGGILAGQSLIQGARLKRIVNDAMRYKASMQAFSLKYQALPGDMLNATRYWGSAGGTGSDAACYTASSTTTPVCNGNGNGFLDFTAGGYGETFQAWKHMANEGLIEGTYNGHTGTSSTYHNIPGTNAPNGAMDATGYSLWNMTDGYIDAYWFPAQAGNVMFFGTATTQLTSGWTLTGQEMAGIDNKLDDGLPALGDVRAPKNNLSCVTTAVPTTAEYVKSGASVSCTPIFWIDHAGAE